MAEYIIQEKTLNSIANAIRGKTGKTEALDPNTMVTEINNLEIDRRKLPTLNPNFPKDINTTVIKGNTTSATFSVSISEAGNPARYDYQWYVDGVAVSGANGSSYTINNISNTISHEIYCEVIHDLGSITSRIATLNVVQYYTPTLNPDYPKNINTAVIKGNTTSATFSVSISEAGNPAVYTYQWYVDGVAVSGANGSSYTKTNLSTTDSYEIYCAITNDAGTITSRTAILNVTQYYTPIIQEGYPTDISVLKNESATFSVPISEEGVPAKYTYQWYENNTAIAGATSSTYTKTNTSVEGTYSIHCVVTNIAGSVTSRSATLTILSYYPVYTYNGTSTLTKETETDWKLLLKTGGTINFSHLGNAVDGIDVFCVGGGGGSISGCGGGGGRTTTQKNVSISKDVNYTIVVGSGGPGGSSGGSGGTTSAFNVSASGGNIGSPSAGGSGGSGGGSFGGDAYAGGEGGSDGGPGGTPWWQHSSGGSGQGTTTREFGMSSGTLYAGGGAGAGGAGLANGGAGGGGNGSKTSYTAGAVNTGGGGGAGYYSGASGGSGIVIIRNKRG